MAYRSFSLIPELNNNLLSDRFTQMENLFSRLTGEKPISDIPDYNLLQTDKGCYEITVSVPGYKKDELDISVLNNQLNINGKKNIKEIEKKESQNEIKWLHKGINKVNFSLSFNLESKIKIRNVSLDKGLLSLQFNYDIPEKEKPQKIDIIEKSLSNKTIENNSA